MSRDGPSDIENQTAGPVPLPHRTDGLGCTPLGGPGSTAKVPQRMRSSYLCGSSVPSNVTGQRSTAWHALRALRAWIAEVWITPAPSADHPLRVSQGRWGMHTQSYKLYPKEYVDRVTRFFDQRFTDIPEDVLGLLDAHLLDLCGTSGDPNAGDPIQYDEGTDRARPGRRGDRRLQSRHPAVRHGSAGR